MSGNVVCNDMLADAASKLPITLPQGLVPLGMGSGGGRTAGCCAPGNVESASITKNSGRIATEAVL